MVTSLGSELGPMVPPVQYTTLDGPCESDDRCRLAVEFPTVGLCTYFPKNAAAIDTKETTWSLPIGFLTLGGVCLYGDNDELNAYTSVYVDTETDVWLMRGSVGTISVLENNSLHSVRSCLRFFSSGKIYCQLSLGLANLTFRHLSASVQGVGHVWGSKEIIRNIFFRSEATVSLRGKEKFEKK